jgi:cell volume regulation protein A
LFVARPLSVALSVTAFRFNVREQAFLSWAALRGAVPIVLATIPLSTGVDGAEGLFNIVFVLVLIYTIAQGGSLAQFARWVRVAAPTEAAELEVEVAPLENLRADLLQVEVVAGSKLAGVHVDELRLPVGAAVMLVARDGAAFVPERDTRLRAGDSLLVVATQAARRGTEQRLRAVNRRGRLAGWFAEYGDDRPVGR